MPQSRPRVFFVALVAATPPPAWLVSPGPAAASRLAALSARASDASPGARRAIGCGGGCPSRRARNLTLADCLDDAPTERRGTAPTQTERAARGAVAGLAARCRARARKRRAARSAPCSAAPARRRRRRSGAGRGALRRSRRLPAHAGRRLEPPVPDRRRGRQDPRRG